jgi:hypothetical protein
VYIARIYGIDGSRSTRPRLRLLLDTCILYDWMRGAMADQAVFLELEEALQQLDGGGRALVDGAIE